MTVGDAIDGLFRAVPFIFGGAIGGVICCAISNSAGYREGQIDAMNHKWLYIRTHGEVVKLSKPTTRPEGE